MNYRAGLRGLAALLTVLLIAPGSAWVQGQARIYVIESTVSTIQVGKEYALTDTIALPAGATIRAVMPSGKTQTIRGPYSGSVADLAKGQKLNERVFAWIRNFFETGGAQEKTTGAARGMLPPPSPSPFSWTAVPVWEDNVLCVVKGDSLQLVRPASQATARITVVDIERAQKGEARWAKGSLSTAWPSSVGLRPDAIYTLLVPDQEPRELKLRILDRVPGDEDLLTELAARGCRHQFDAWMRSRPKNKAS
jgi:hypothetical protein